MTGWRFLTALLAIPLLGLPLGSRLFRGSGNTLARWGFGGAAGAVLLCAEMVVLTVLGISWSPWILILLPAALFLFGRTTRDRAGADAGTRPESAPRFEAALIVASLGAVAYATATARATAGDFLLFWGAKGEHFALSRSIDAAFLGDPFHSFMNPQYPPLLPTLYAWGTMVAGGFSWGAALLTMPIALALTGATFLGFARPSCGTARATVLTAVLVSMLGLVMVAIPVAGNAEPLLLYFETVSLAALLFKPAGERSFAIAGVGLAGAAMTKVEGGIFALLVVVAYVIWGRDRRAKTLAALWLPPFLAVSAWVGFYRAHGLVEQYPLSFPSSLTALPLIGREMARQASFGVAYIPWLAPALIAIRGEWSEGARIAATVGLGFLGALACIYLGGGKDPGLWVLWSAGRLLMTPLLCLFLAAAAGQAGGPDVPRVEA